MKKTLGLLVFTSLLLSSVPALTAEKDTRFFEMRIYYAAPGKFDNMLARFRDHTLKLFEKHGMENIGYWVPLTNTESKLIYVLAYPSREAREKSWKAFSNDPDWQAAYKASEKEGKLVAKAEAIYLKPTDFSPVAKPRGHDSRVFEMRTYTAAPGKLDDLLARFRNHTVGLFAKHGMDQLAYWVPTESKDGAGNKLIYILSHNSLEAAATSFKAFRADPAWVKAKADSETNGPLTAPNGVKSEMLKATDFSP